MCKKAIYLWICIILIVPAGMAQDAATLLRDADRLETLMAMVEAKEG